MARARRVLRFLATAVVAFIVFAAGWVTAKTGMGEAFDPDTLPQIERAFVEQMNGAALVGRFTVHGREDRVAVADRYDLYSVDKIGPDEWRFNARIGETGLTVPVVVTMKFVNDTPLILLTDAGLAGVGPKFSARVLFYGDLYAGTWGDGQRSGVLYGRIERGAAQK